MSCQWLQVAFTLYEGLTKRVTLFAHECLVGRGEMAWHPQAPQIWNHLVEGRRERCGDV